MIPFFKLLVQAMLFDSNAFKRWMRGSLGVLATGGAAYADQLASTFGAPKAAMTVRAVSLLAAFGVAAHGDKVE